MLVVFSKSLSHPPHELKVPGLPSSNPSSIIKDFNVAHSFNSRSFSFPNGALLAYVPEASLRYQRLFCGLDGIYCLFMGTLNNLNTLIKEYGISKIADEAMFVIEAYRTLRDRGPYPADQVVNGFNGNFAFVVYDDKTKTVFIALGGDGSVELYWGLASDGSLVISDELEAIKRGCTKSYAPFPTGCMFHSGAGLTSFEEPMKRMRAMPRVDSEGIICGCNFKIDKFSRISTMPRVGSEANWSMRESS